MPGAANSPAMVRKASLQARTRRILRELRPYRPEQVILFGSAARGESDSESDIDLVIVKRTREPFVRRLARVARLIGETRVDVLVYTPEEVRRMKDESSPFWERIEREGRLLYAKPG